MLWFPSRQFWVSVVKSSVMPKLRGGAGCPGGGATQAAMARIVNRERIRVDLIMLSDLQVAVVERYFLNPASGSDQRTNAT